MSEEFDFNFTDTPGKLALDQLQEAFEYLWQQICDLQENPIEPVQPGVVLADGTVPMEACLVLADGCLGDEHAMRWAEFREWFAANFFAVAVDQHTDANGVITVPLTGASFGSPPTVTVTQSGLSGLTPAVAEGAVTFSVSAVTPTNATVTVFESLTGNPVAAQAVRFHLQAVMAT